MDFCKTVIHVVQPGDTYYRLAQRYQTTVPDIIMRNPGINPYNLQIGTRLKICSGHVENPMQKDELDLNNDMRDAWGEHGFWGSVYLMSENYELPGSAEVSDRLLRTPEAISSVFGQFYSQMMVNQLNSLLMEHVRLAGDLFKAKKAGSDEEAAQIGESWENNAKKIARMLSGANNEYSYEGLLKMLDMHLEQMRQQMDSLISGNYAGFISTTDEAQKHLMELSDELTAGLVKQFYMDR